MRQWNFVRSAGRRWRKASAQGQYLWDDPCRTGNREKRRRPGGGVSVVRPCWYCVWSGSERGGMDSWKLCDSGYRFMNVVWDSAPVPSGELVALCARQLGWKKSTTYTMVKKLAQKGLLRNENAVVTALVPRRMYRRRKAPPLWSALSADPCRRSWRPLWAAGRSVTKRPNRFRH